MDKMITEVPEGFIDRSTSPEDEYFPKGVERDTPVEVIITRCGKLSLHKSVAGSFGWNKAAHPGTHDLDTAPITHYRIAP